MESDNQSESLKQWSEAVNKIFPNGAPAHREWTDLNEIVDIINIVSLHPESNHMFLPKWGGIDIEGAEISEDESECIEIIAKKDFYRFKLKPKKLSFTCIDNNPDWSYFLLYADDLEPTETYIDKGYEVEDILKLRKEELLRLADGTLLSRMYLDLGFVYDEDFNRVSIPEGHKLVYRYFNGTFAIFPKDSFYYIYPDSYSALHEQDSIKFKEIIAELKKLRIKKYRLIQTRSH